VISEAGQIAPSVRDYIKKEQDIACEIPGLKIGSNGKLAGGCLPGTTGDCLDGVRSKASENVNVVIGPDNIGTLSFTSGSTGIPKGKE
jgi:L-aminoadipate-semialdehyde dehydrogenase